MARARRVVCARGRRLDGGYYVPDELVRDVNILIYKFKGVIESNLLKSCCTKMSKAGQVRAAPSKLPSRLGGSTQPGLAALLEAR
jgi:hypothetical protein